MRKKNHFLCRLFRATSASVETSAGCRAPLPDPVVPTLPTGLLVILVSSKGIKCQPAMLLAFFPYLVKKPEDYGVWIPLSNASKRLSTAQGRAGWSGWVRTLTFFPCLMCPVTINCLRASFTHGTETHRASPVFTILGTSSEAMAKTAMISVLRDLVLWWERQKMSK